MNQGKLEASAVDGSAQHSAKKQPLQAAEVADALLKLETVCAITGLSAPTIYRKVANDPTFPRLIRLSARCTRVRAGDLTNWMAAQASKAEASGG